MGRAAGKPFPFEAKSPSEAAHEVAADSDLEPHQVIEVEVSDGRCVEVYEVATRPPYAPHHVESRRLGG